MMIDEMLMQRIKVDKIANPMEARRGIMHVTIMTIKTKVMRRRVKPQI